MSKDFLYRCGRSLIRQMRKINLFRRLIISFMVVILIPTIVIGSSFYINVSRQNQTNIEQLSQRAMANLEASIVERMKRYEDLSYSLYLNEELRGYLRECAALANVETLSQSQKELYDNACNGIGQILDRASVQHPDILNIEIVTDSDEFVQARSEGKTNNRGSVISLRDPQSFRETEAYKRASINGGLPVWFNTARDITFFKLRSKSNTSLGQYITLLRTISERWQHESEKLGTIVINVSLTVFRDLTNPLELDTPDKHAVLVGDGEIVMFFGAKAGGPYITLGPSEIEAIKSGGYTPQKIRLNGKLYVANAVDSKRSDWMLISLFPQSVIQMASYDLVLMLVMIILACVVLAVAVSFVVTVSIANPIRRLYDTMQQVQDDSIHIQYEDYAQDEVGILNQRFNSMLRRIQHLIYTVYEVELEKKEEVLRRKEAQLDALQMQINPHFLYNTLDIIRWKVLSEAQTEGGRAGKMLVQFSDLLKYSTRGTEKLVQIQDEIEHISSYISVLEFDMTYSLQITVQLEPSVLLLPIPKLSFQPLVENAYVHAFHENMTNARLWIYSRTINNNVEIIIENNGKASDESHIDGINRRLDTGVRNGKHIGLHNVNERLKLQFGQKYGLRLMRLSNGNTATILLIPGIQNDATVNNPESKREGAN